MINIADLIGFINEAGKAGYEQDKPKNIKKESDGSTTIWHERGDWKLHDNFFGGEPYGGRTIIHYKYKPVHITVYYGFVDKTGAWFIMKEESSGAYRYTKGDSNFSTNWTTRNSL